MSGWLGANFSSQLDTLKSQVRRSGHQHGCARGQVWSRAWSTGSKGECLMVVGPGVARVVTTAQVSSIAKDVFVVDEEEAAAQDVWRGRAEGGEGGEEGLEQRCARLEEERRAALRDKEEQCQTFRELLVEKEKEIEELALMVEEKEKENEELTAMVEEGVGERQEGEVHKMEVGHLIT